MTERNRHGLSRSIPHEAARIVRQRCGFGCVVCGSALYNYHHFDPPFEDSADHDPDGITLLCGTHHDYARSMWSTARIKEHDRNPFCKAKGFSWGAFDVGERYPLVEFGTIRIVETPNVLVIDGLTVLRLDPPEIQGGPLRLSAVFLDEESGRELLRIDKNEWQTDAQTWDVEVKGPRIICRVAPRKIGLVLRNEARKRLVIERLEMSYHGYHLFLNTERREWTVGFPNRPKLPIFGVGIDVVRQSSGFVIGADGLRFGGEPLDPDKKGAWVREYGRDRKYDPRIDL